MKKLFSRLRPAIALIIMIFLLASCVNKASDSSDKSSSNFTDYGQSSSTLSNDNTTTEIISDGSGSGTVTSSGGSQSKPVSSGSSTSSKANSSSSNNNSSNTPPGKVESSMNNVLKTYFNGSYYTKADFLPSVAYTVNGQMKDMLFDTFVFLYSPPHDRMTSKSLWESHVATQFTRNTNMDALDAAVGEAKTALNRPNYKVNVIMTIPLTPPEITSFGDVNGKNLDFSKLEDRKTAIKWMVDDQISKFNAKNYQNIQIAGFYWHGEVMRREDADEPAVMQYFTSYVRSLNYITHWGPYFRAYGYERWKEMGFTNASMQVNYFPNTPIGTLNSGGIERLQQTADIVKANGMGVEMELEDTSVRKCIGGFKDYLKGGVDYGFMSGYHVWYIVGGPSFVKSLSLGINESNISNDTYYRSAYDEMYQFIKGTLDPAKMIRE